MNRPIDIMVSAREWSVATGFSPRSIHTKDSKIILDASLLNKQYYKIRIKDKWSNQGKK